MLSEIRNPRQVPGEGQRRWFTDEYFDLIVWHDGDGLPTGFQLCYDKNDRERALTWRSGRGYSHERVDDGEIPGRAKMSPVLVPDGSFARSTIAALFLEDSGAIDPEIRRFVHARLLAGVGIYGPAAPP
jgi:hypothetical protein